MEKKILCLIPAASAEAKNYALMDLDGEALVVRAAKTALSTGVMTTTAIYSNFVIAAPDGVAYIQTPDSLLHQTEACRVRHAIAALKKSGKDGYEAIAILSPLSPFISAQDIMETVNRLGGSAVSSMTIQKYRTDSLTHFRGGVKGNRSGLAGFWHRGSYGPKTGNLFAANRALYVVKPEWLENSDDFITPRSTVWLMPHERSLYIDGVWDFLAANAYMEEFNRLLGIQI